jgi:hypothetical protein
VSPPATPWVPLSVTASTYFEGLAFGPIDGFAMLDIVLEVENGFAFADATAAWTALSTPASSHTELTTPVSTYTELSL